MMKMRCLTINPHSNWGNAQINTVLYWLGLPLVIQMQAAAGTVEEWKWENVNCN